MNLLWAFAVPSGGWAEEAVQVQADTHFQAYEIQSPGTAAFLTRRRLVQTLDATWTRPLGAEHYVDRGEALPTVPRVTGSVRLRLDQDFGETCLVRRDLCVRATDANDPSVYQPLASDTDLDAPEAWVQLNHQAWRTTARVGRQTRYDSMGILRFDGATAQAGLTNWFSLEAYGGALVRRTSLAGSGAFEPIGAIRLDLEDEGVDPSLVPFVDPPTTTWLLGASAHVRPARWVASRLAIQERFESAGLVGRRAAVELSANPTDALRISGSAVWDLLAGNVADAVLSTAVEVGPELSFEARGERHLPFFDRGTIWGYFDLVPIHEVRVGARWEPEETIQLEGAVRGRHASFDDGDETDTGLETAFRIRTGPWHWGLSTFLWDGDLSPVAAVMVDVSRSLGSRFWLDGQASVWHFDDPLRQGLYGTSISEAASVRVQLSDVTRIRMRLEHATSRVVGHRFRGVASLEVEVWR